MTGITRLTTRGGIEDGAVENDAATIVDVHNSRLGFRQVCVFAKQRLGRETHCGITSNGTDMPDDPSIQPGTGRFLPRRNSGLKSLDW